MPVMQLARCVPVVGRSGSGMTDRRGVVVLIGHADMDPENWSAVSEALRKRRDCRRERRRRKNEPQERAAHRSDAMVERVQGEPIVWVQWDGDESPTDETQSDLAVDDTDPAGFGYVLRWLILNPAAHDSGGWARSGPLHDLYKTVGVEIQSRHWRNQTTDADRAALIVAVAEVSR